MARMRGNLNLVLFGFDLTRIPTFFRQGWSEAMAWPLFMRLLPPEPVRVKRPDGGKAIWPTGASPRAHVANAVVLPEEFLLRRTLRLPFLAPAAQREAIELALGGASPFPPENTARGWRAAPRETDVEVELVMASRAHVDAYLLRTVNEQHLADVEVWAASATGDAPIVLRGYGEGPRQARARRRHLRIAALAALALILMLALAASPVLRMRQDVFDLGARLDAVTHETAPAVADREALVNANARLQAVSIYAQAHPDPQEMLGRLAALLPDSAFLTRLEIRGRTVIIAGLAENAARLMDLLSAQPGFHDVRALTAITRDASSGRESFSVEFHFNDAPPPTAP